MKRTLAALAVCLATSGHAQPVTAGSLLDMLQSKDKATAQFGAGFVHGIFDVNEGLAQCAPPAASDQSVDLVRGYLAANPQVLKLPASLAVMLVLSNQWPCHRELTPQSEPPVEHPKPGGTT